MSFYRTAFASVLPGSQFLGTEFRVQSGESTLHSLVFKEADLQMGSESKTWEIFKRTVEGLEVSIAKSNGADTSTSVVVNDTPVILAAGDQLQIRTTGATAAMKAKLYFHDEVI